MPAVRQKLHLSPCADFRDRLCYIELLNLTPRPEEREWATLIVRLPVCGGTAKLTLGITQHWVDLYEVWR